MSDEYLTKTAEFEHELETDGSGLWSEVERKVQTTRLELSYDPADEDGDLYGELRVYFDDRTWNNRKDGLIYTDKGWLDDLRMYLEVNGLDDSDVEYSEQGMQGTDYVSLDVGEEFINSWNLNEWAHSGLAGK